MEKQPIDELFRGKLYEAEIAPDDTAWNALQKRLGNQRILPLWTYISIAASLLLIGSFSWWMLTSLNKIGTDVAVIQGVASAKKMKPFIESQQLAGVRKENKVILPVEVKGESVEHKDQTIHKASTDRKTELVTTAQKPGNIAPAIAPSLNPAKPDVDTEIVQTTSQPKQLEVLPFPTLPKGQLMTAVLPIAERTLVVSIEAPTDAVSKPTRLIAVAENNASRSGLGTLFGKVRKIKDGDVFAAGTTKMTKSSRRGLGKFYDDVKESIQNNTADE